MEEYHLNWMYEHHLIWEDQLKDPGAGWEFYGEQEMEKLRGNE